MQNVIALRLIKLCVPLLTLSLTACATGTHATNCAGWRPITTVKEDVLSRQTQDEINSHNVNGEKKKCWQPPKRKAK